MESARAVVFSRPVRTAIGTFGGSLKEVVAPELGAVAIKAALERAGIKPEAVETVVMGNVVQAGAKMNPARQAAVHAGLPVKVPAMTVNRVCGSGAQAIVSAAPMTCKSAGFISSPSPADVRAAVSSRHERVSVFHHFACSSHEFVAGGGADDADRP
jgi:hypothetical protein